jgi:hypothetical protein
MAPNEKRKVASIEGKNDKKLFTVAITKIREKANITTIKKRVRMPDDTVLDMLRFFTRRALFSFKFVSRRMKRVVELGDQKKQLRQRLVISAIKFSVYFVAFSHFSIF